MTQLINWAAGTLIPLPCCSPAYLTFKEHEACVRRVESNHQAMQPIVMAYVHWKARMKDNRQVTAILRYLFPTNSFSDFLTGRNIRDFS